MSFKKGERVFRSGKKPIVDLGRNGDEANVGVCLGLVGTVRDEWQDSTGTQKYTVEWDALPGNLLVYTDDYLEPSKQLPMARGMIVINKPFDLSVCCGCHKPNEYGNDVNCDSGWRCGECRAIRSML